MSHNIYIALCAHNPELIPKDIQQHGLIASLEQDAIEENDGNIKYQLGYIVLPEEPEEETEIREE